MTIILFKIWPTNRFSKAKSCNFHFRKNDVTCLLMQMAYYMKTLPGRMQKAQTIGMTSIILGRTECFCRRIGQLCRIWRDHMEKFLDNWDDGSNWRLSQKSSLLFLNGYHLSRQTFGLPFTFSSTQMSQWVTRKNI